MRERLKDPNVVLLAAILVVQFMILSKMPGSGDIVNVKVVAPVEVGGTVDVEVTNAFPIEVEIR